MKEKEKEKKRRRKKNTDGKQLAKRTYATN